MALYVPFSVHGRWSRKSRARRSVVSPRFGAEKHEDELDNICDLGDLRAQMPKKEHEAGPTAEQLPSDALSKIDYRHTRHCEDCKEVCL